MKQRIIMLVAAVLGGLIWLGAAGTLRAADGGAAYSITTGQGGAVLGAVAVLAFGLPAMAMGLFTSATGHPLSGVFTLGVALAIVAGQGGPIDDWLYYQASHGALPGAYGLLAMEVLLWQFVVLLGVYAVQRWRADLRRKLPRAAKSTAAVLHPSLAEEIEADEHPQPAPIGALAQVAEQLGPMATTAAVAGLLGFFLIRSSDTGQVIWSLVAAFAMAAFVSQLVFRSRNSMGVLCSPALLAVAAYGLALMNFDSSAGLLKGWYNLNEGMAAPAGLALVLPIQYVAAGTVGCCIGLGVGQAFMHEELVLDEA